MRNRSLASLALVVGAVMLQPVAATAQAPGQDLVTAGNAATTAFSEITIDAQSGPSGENPTGTGFFRVSFIGGIQVGGPVTCLTVSGNRATLNLSGAIFGPIQIQVVDNAGTGRPDLFDSSPFTPGCSPTFSFSTPLTSGDITVVDAPPPPTSRDQCQNGGWRNFPGFKNQGDCVSYIATRGKHAAS